LRGNYLAASNTIKVIADRSNIIILEVSFPTSTTPSVPFQSVPNQNSSKMQRVILLNSAFQPGG